MEKVNRLLNNEEYREMLSCIQEAEKERIFCRHDMRHFLDMARLLHIYCLEEGIKADKPLIYAIGLLHDIGRAAQYKTGEEHHTASARAAEKLMPTCGFDEEQTKTAVNAILSHRSGSEDKFFKLVYKADKKSRLCFECKARGECNWPKEKMNLEIEI